MAEHIVTNDALILFFGQRAKVTCDRQCHKAWGINTRARVQFSDDADDYAFLADDELGTAPADPGTYEGNAGKPASPHDFPNKWCIRECERSSLSAPGKFDCDLPLRTFGTRFYNQPWKHADAQQLQTDLP